MTCDATTETKLCPLKNTCQFYKNYLDQFTTQELKFNQIKKDTSKKKTCFKQRTK
jgi:hypothetical protein